ncbi:alpha/beta hydrolase [Psychromonas sp. PT13]|uniref:alpha/beta hydrolase n=1 Tax=Psychromonas sp. PT13 TaxID=3439547 RepID=UPI003EC0B895
MSYLDCVEVQTDIPATASIIWLHGLGANGHDFEPIVPELRLPNSLPVRFIFPHSPSIPVSINGGMTMPAWYDILDMSIERKVDLTNLTESAMAVQALIDREIERGIDSSRIIVAGFSQGGAVAYQAALTYPKPLAGLLAMSTYFATKDSITLSEANKDISINIMHGSQDPVVVPTLGDDAASTLNALGYQPSYKQYPMEHAVCSEQVSDISTWIQSVLA